MFRLLRYIKGYRAQAVVAPLCKLIEAIAELAVPMIIANVIDVGVAGGDKDYVIKYCIVIAALAVGGFLISVTGQFLASKVALGFGTRLRSDAFKHINALSAPSSDRMGASSLVTRLTSDVLYCQNTLNMTLRLALRVPFVVLGSFVMSMIIDPVLSLLFVAMAAVLGCIITCVLKLTYPRMRKAQVCLDEISRLTSQSLSGARVIRAFNRRDASKREFDKTAEHTAKINTSALITSALLNPLTFAVVNLAIIAVLWFGGVKVNDGALTQGQIVALINYFNQAFFAIVVVANVFPVFARSSVCSARVNEILDDPLPVEGDAESVEKGDYPVVEMRNVSFAYEGDYDVRDVSFKLYDGKTLGIIGGTGSGKTTVVNLLERFYDPQRGEVLFCDKNVKSYKLCALRKNLGYVPQRAAVMSGTLKSNLAVADENATDERMEKAMELAQATELLESLGLDGKVSQDGKNLSGGQRQRVSIARSLCRDNILYLFDDCTSALDYKTERAFLNALKTVDGAKILVSQRISAVSDCDEILVLDGGNVVGRGTHDELKATCPLYAEFCASQTEDA